MPIQLFQFNAFPDEIAVTKTEFVSAGVFFLDFTRPLKPIRWLGTINTRFGFTVGLFVPVVHEGEHRGGYVVGIDRRDPYFRDVLALWRTRYPSARGAPHTKADGLKIISDFAVQFPEGSQSP